MTDESGGMIEAFVFKLGQPLGGRREVIDAPVVELLEYMSMKIKQEEQEAEKEQAKMWINYLTAVFTQPSFGGKEDPQFARSRKEFVDSIMPQKKEPVKELNGPAKVYEWDENLMKKLKEKQDALMLERRN